jgi:predicted nucleic acid-binding protein
MKTPLSTRTPRSIDESYHAAVDLRGGLRRSRKRLRQRDPHFGEHRFGQRSTVDLPGWHSQRRRGQRDVDHSGGECGAERLPVHSRAGLSGVRRHCPTSEFYAASDALLERTKTAGAGLCIAPQNLAEFYAIVTNARRVATPRTPEEALAVIEQFLERPGLELIPVPADIVARWVELVRRHPVVGGDLFEIQLIATMLGNGITRIYTFNPSVPNRPGCSKGHIES